MQNHQPLRGFKDIIDKNGDYFELYSLCLKIAKQNCYYEAITPVLEKSSLFERGMGEDSDAASKELYKFNFYDESLALRPEFTAGIARMIINYPEFIKGHKDKLGLSLFSFAPVFRHDRPQAGRYRQFFQANFECFKSTSPLTDASCITMAIEILSSYANLQDSGLSLVVKINSLGSQQTKQKYASLLTDYLQDHQEGLSEDSKARLVKNPLRILDSKDAKDREILQNAPKITDCLSEDEVSHFNRTCLATEQFLQSNPCYSNVKLQSDFSLVRGLDYYTSTVFEILPVVNGKEGLTVFAGGRYDDLISSLSDGKCKMPAFGFACGVERLIELKYQALSMGASSNQLQNKPSQTKLAVIIICNKDNYPAAFKLALQVKNQALNQALQANASFAYRVIEATKSKLNQALEHCEADGFNARCIIGDKEVESNTVPDWNIKPVS